MPAHQRLDPDDATGAQVDLRLILEEQRPVGDGAAQAQLDQVALFAFRLHLLGEHADSVAALGFRGHDRLVAPAEQCARRHLARMPYRDPDTDAATDHLAPEPHPLGHHVADVLCPQFRFREVDGPAEDEDEFITTEACDEVVGCAARPKPIRDRGDESVTGPVAEEVVERLQPVEVEEQDGHRARIRRTQPRVEMAVEGAPVTEPGEGVVIGRVPQLFLDGDTRLHLCEQSGDSLEDIDLGRRPVAIAELDEPEGARRRLPDSNGTAASDTSGTPDASRTRSL